jgi:hypothetical protein
MGRFATNILRPAGALTPAMKDTMGCTAKVSLQSGACATNLGLVAVLGPPLGRLLLSLNRVSLLGQSHEAIHAQSRLRGGLDRCTHTHTHRFLQS